MSSDFVGVSSTSTAGGTSVTLAKPSGTREGDLLVLGLVVADFSATPPTAPSGWVVESSPAQDGAHVQFVATKYAGASEASTYTFTRGSSTAQVAFMAAYRGVSRDRSHAGFPEGYYNSGAVTPAPRMLDESFSVRSDNTGFASPAIVPYARAWLLMGATKDTATLHMSDVIPLIAMRAKIEILGVSAMLCDVALPAEDLVYVVGLDQAASAAVVTCRVLEPVEARATSYDTYKGKLLRKMMPPPYDRRYGSNIGKLLTIIGASDNDIGGLFGEEDFLPDEV